MMTPSDRQLSDPRSLIIKRSLCCPPEIEPPLKYKKKYPVISLDSGEILTKVQTIIETICNSVFAIPFLASRTVEDVTSKRPDSFEAIRRRLGMSMYTHTAEVFGDIDNVMKEREEDGVWDLVLSVNNHSYTVRMNNLDVKVVADKIRKSVTAFIDTISDNLPLYEHPSQSTEKDFSEELSVEDSSIEDSKTKVFRFDHCQKTPSNHEHAIHNYIAGFHFQKMISKYKNNNVKIPVPRRIIHNPWEAISHIDYIQNLNQLRVFQRQRELFCSQNKDTSEVLLFYGTLHKKVATLVMSNIALEQEEQDKKLIFGKGIYLSKHPEIALMYGNGLVLCKVLMGNCEEFRPKSTGIQPPLPPMNDSRVVLTNDRYGVIHVVRSPAQILPYCVIQLKKEALGVNMKRVFAVSQSLSHLKI